jgi:hypothetical protein
MIWVYAAVGLWLLATATGLAFIYGATKGRDRVPTAGDRQLPTDER